MIDKVYPSAAEAVADIASGSSLAVGGFGLCGMPETLIDAILELGSDNLETVSNNCGVKGFGLSVLLEANRIRRTIGSYIGTNVEYARQFLAGEVEVELIPQGTLSERLRAGGTGIPAFYTRAGAGTQYQTGGLPLRYGPDGQIAKAAPAKETREFDGETYLLEHGIVCDFGLVKAKIGDRHGNLVYDKSAQNFNPLCAMAGRVTIAEVETLVEPGEIDPAEVHTPGVFVKRVVHCPDAPKRIEMRTVRAPQQPGDVAGTGGK